MRLIDADAVLDTLDCGDRDLWVKYTLDEAPTIEAEPVKHGRWIDGADSFGAPRGMYRVCSVCNICFPKTFEVPEQYWRGCPNCLSKMDGGDADA